MEESRPCPHPPTPPPGDRCTCLALIANHRNSRLKSDLLQLRSGIMNAGSVRILWEAVGIIATTL